MNKGYFVSSTTLILLMAMFASFSEGIFPNKRSPAPADYFRIKIQPAEIVQLVTIYKGTCMTERSPPNVAQSFFDKIEYIPGEYRIKKPLGKENHCLQVFKKDGTFSQFIVASNVTKRNHLFLIDFTNSTKGITREVAKEDEAKLGQNEDVERKKKEQLEEEARKKTELTDFANNLAQNFSTQVETMFMKVNKEWMATVDAKFVAYSEAMKAKLEESRKQIAASNLAILQNAKITIGKEEKTLPEFLSGLEETIGKKMTSNHKNLTKSFDVLLTNSKDSLKLVEEVKEKIEPIGTDLKKIVTEQQGKGIDAVAVKSNVEAIQGNMYKFLTDFCEIFHCNRANMSPDLKMVLAHVISPAQSASKVVPEFKPAPTSSKVVPEPKPAPTASKVVPESNPAPAASKAVPESNPAPAASKVVPESNPAPAASKDVVLESKVVPEAKQTRSWFWRSK